MGREKQNVSIKPPDNSESLAKKKKIQLTAYILKSISDKTNSNSNYVLVYTQKYEVK